MTRARNSCSPSVSHTYREYNVHMETAALHTRAHTPKFVAAAAAVARLRLSSLANVNHTLHMPTHICTRSLYGFSRRVCLSIVGVRYVSVCDFGK